MNTEMMAAVIAYQVRNRRPRHGRGKGFGVRGKERRIETTPGVADDSDPVRFNETHIDHSLYGRAHAFDDGDGQVASPGVES